jgi:hypothetical protein
MDIVIGLETQSDKNTPFVPLVEEALGTEDIPYGTLGKTHSALVTLTTELCTDIDTRDNGADSFVRIFCSPEVPYARLGATNFSLRLVVSGRHLSAQDTGEVSTIEIELVSEEEGNPKTYRSIAAMSPSYLSVNAEERAYGHSSELADLQGFLQTVDFIQARLPRATSSATT